MQNERCGDRLCYPNVEGQNILVELLSRQSHHIGIEHDNGIGPGIEQFVEDGFRNAEPAGRVLAIDDHEIGIASRAESTFAVINAEETCWFKTQKFGQTLERDASRDHTF